MISEQNSRLRTSKHAAMAQVTIVFGDCPGCGAKNKFGNIEIFDGKNILRGCKACPYVDHYPLPVIKKKILYLDQFFFSHAFRAHDSRFVEASKRIEKLASMQLLVAPFSSIHEDETHQWEFRTELFKFIKNTSRGHKFFYAPEVDKTQIIKAFQSWLNNGPPEYELTPNDALRKNIHNWQGYTWFDVGRYLGDIELIRKLKTLTIENLVSGFPVWRDLKTSYKEDLATEFLDGAREYVNAFAKYASRISIGDLNALLDSPASSEVVRYMLSMLPEELDFPERLKICGRFFDSEHFRQTPYTKLSCSIFATLRKHVKEGQFSNEERAKEVLSGFIFDVGHVSTYAPYCDAFFMDKSMADLVARPTVSLEAIYGTRVFSLTNWQAFIEWLDGIEAELDDVHRAALMEVYWPQPNRVNLSPPPC